MFHIISADLEQEVEALRSETLRLKGMVSSLDRERDLLQQEVDQKAEMLVESEATKARQVILLPPPKLLYGRNPHKRTWFS